MKYWRKLRHFAHQEAHQHGARSADWNWAAFHDGADAERMEDYVARLEAENVEEAHEQMRAEHKHHRFSEMSLYEEIHLLVIQAAKHQGRHRQVLLKRAAKTACREGHPIGRVRYLEQVLPLADARLRIQLTEEVLSDVAKYKFEDAIAVYTAGLLPYSDVNKRAERVRVCLQRVFSSWPASFRKVDFSTDQIVLAMARFWCEFSTAELYETWLGILNDISQLSRPDLLITSAALTPLVTQLGGMNVRQEVVEAISDVTRWWP